MKWALSQLLLPLAATGVACWPESKGREIKFSPVGGYFLQDDPDTNPTGFDYADWNLGLINRTYPTDSTFDPEGAKPQWERFTHWIEHVNGKCQGSDRTRYKVLIMGRHGEGWHNAAESFYGTPAWNCYWAVQDGNSTATWADALLTPAGEREALKANTFFKSHFADHGFPFFESYYSSPLVRCTTTADLTFGDIAMPESRPFAPVIKEYLREGMRIHTCNHRSNKTYIQSITPNFTFEDGFTFEDELWRRDESETGEHQLARSKEVLEDIFTSDDATWISISSHSGEITKLLEALGHRPFRLATGQIIPVLVKITVSDVEEEPPATTAPGFIPEATCTEPPVTSIAGEGCVCSETPSAFQSLERAL